MKKISKILSSVLAASMVMSCCIVNTFAASTAHTVTITPSKTTDIEAGDVITVEIAMDNTANIVSAEYEFYYDTEAFSVDTTTVSRLEKCIDSAWYNDIKDSDDWGYYFGKPTYNVIPDEGAFKFQWFGTEGIEADYAVDNRVIGKFILTANADITGEHTFTLTGNSMDSGENSTADFVCEPVTVSFKGGSTEPEPPTEEAAAPGIAIDDKYYTFSTPAPVEVSATGNAPTFIITKSGSEREINELLPNGVVGEGYTKILPIVSYKIDQNEVAVGDIFTLVIKNGDATVGTWTYTVPSAE